jgi:hypothetical protein
MWFRYVRWTRMLNRPTDQYLCDLFLRIHYHIHYHIQCLFEYSNIYPTRSNVTQFYLYLKTALHVSGGTSTHHQERIQLYLQHPVFVTPSLLSAANVKVCLNV